MKTADESVNKCNKFNQISTSNWSFSKFQLCRSSNCFLSAYKLECFWLQLDVEMSSTTIQEVFNQICQILTLKSIVFKSQLQKCIRMHRNINEIERRSLSNTAAALNYIEKQNCVAFLRCCCWRARLTITFLFISIKSMLVIYCSMKRETNFH